MKPTNHKTINRRRAIAPFLLALGVMFLSAATSFAQSATNIAAVVTAANAFMALLTTAQKTAIDATTTPINSSCLYNNTLANVEVWSNIPVGAATRNGLQFSALTTAQQTAALAVANAALSDAGTNLLEQVRLSDKYISGEVTNLKGTTSAAWGYSKYFIAFVGTPSTNSAWTLQIGGHHIAYNINYNGTHASGTPLFAGTEPNSFIISSVTYAPLGTQRTLLASLRPTLTTSALLSGTFSDVVFGPNGTGSHDTTQPKVYPTTGRGQLYSALNSTQQAWVVSYIESWVNKMDASVSATLLPIYTNATALAETYIGYAGSSTTLSANANYFRVDGPRVWIEFSVQTGVYDNTSVHDHGIWRDKLADYGAAYGSTTVATTVRPPTINTQPASQTNALGSSAIFSVSATSTGTGTATLAYQWYKDGSAIAGATSSSYAIASVVAGSAGTFSVKVISTGGLTTSSTATLTVTTAANTAPTLSAVSDRTITPGTSLSITNVATDSDSPAQTLTFVLLTAPTNATLGTSSGILAWRPLIAQASATNAFSVSVTDSGSPAMSATQSFSVIVSAATAPSNSTVSYSGGAYQFSVAGIVGPDYIIQASTNLTTWETLYTTNPTAMPFNYTDSSAGNFAARFFRVLLGP